MSSDLRHALATVERALAAADRAIGRPARHDTAWFAHQRGVMDECAKHLTDELGAKISDRHDKCRVQIAGVAATCTAGMSGALHNWMAAARRRLPA